MIYMQRPWSPPSNENQHSSRGSKRLETPPFLSLVHSLTGAHALVLCQNMSQQNHAKPISIDGVLPSFFGGGGLLRTQPPSLPTTPV